ncbi:hypothetical protein AZ78_1195 [Lysobacter capsici AZ78]|uniref:Uncharacterized protein n=1 Tax=Lysobacter capsici AZ78 TaxID=1444315 RepID=A0A108U6V9_9GAMM|nr:hypothetical protein AZ78_1195 [Lysobacter capsici AZ78]
MILGHRAFPCVAEGNACGQGVRTPVGWRRRPPRADAWTLGGGRTVVLCARAGFAKIRPAQGAVVEAMAEKRDCDSNWRSMGRVQNIHKMAGSADYLR